MLKNITSYFEFVCLKSMLVHLNLFGGQMNKLLAHTLSI